MKLTDITAVLNTTAATTGTAAAGSFQVAAGPAAGDGIVGFSILDAGVLTSIWITPSASDSASVMATALEALASAEAAWEQLKFSVTTDTIDISTVAVDASGNDIVVTDISTDTSTTGSVIVQPTGGVNPGGFSESVTISVTGLDDLKVTKGILTQQPSILRRLMLQNGMIHDLETGSTSNMISHALAVRILEQL